MKNKILVISTFFLLIISIFSLTYAANVTNSIENGVMDIKAAAEDTGIPLFASPSPVHRNLFSAFQFPPS